MLLVGNSGTGKTHVASALAFAACAQGHRVRFFTVSGLVTLLLEAREERQLERMLKHLQRQELLLLDELGYVPFSKPGAELLFEVVKRAIDRNENQRVAGNLFNQTVVIKYEIENFKDQAVTLDIVENLRYIRNEALGRDTGKDVHQLECGSDDLQVVPPDDRRPRSRN